MWIETFDGMLLNLANVHRLVIAGGNRGWRVEAELAIRNGNKRDITPNHFPLVVIQGFETKEEAEELMKLISARMKENLIRISAPPEVKNSRPSSQSFSTMG